jgi:hypothetical protein
MVIGFRHCVLKLLLPGTELSLAHIRVFAYHGFITVLLKYNLPAHLAGQIIEQ